jgi:cyclin-dependent kinase
MRGGCRLLCVEHVEENNKPCLYLVFEYLTTDLKKYMDRNGKGPNFPLPKPTIKARSHRTSHPA